MDGLAIRKLYDSHENEVWTIERLFRNKTKIEEYGYSTHTQLSIHMKSKKGNIKKFMWRNTDHPG